MCGPEDPPFHASPVVHKGPISSKRVSSQDPLLRKFGNFAQILAHKPQIWKFSVHKLPLSEASISLQAPHFRNPGCTSLPEKELSAPLGNILQGYDSINSLYTAILVLKKLFFLQHLHSLLH